MSEVKHLLEAGYSTLIFYHNQVNKGLMTDSGAQWAAADAVRSMRYGTNNYYFIWDLAGTSIANGAQPALEGRTYLNSPDADKNPVVAYMVHQLLNVVNGAAKEGFTSYSIPKWGHTEPLDNISYSRLFEPWGWSIGTGAYVDDINDEFRKRGVTLLIRTVVLTLAAVILTFIIVRDLVKPLKRLSDRITSVAHGELDGPVLDTDRMDEVGSMARALLLLRNTSKEAAELRLDQLTGLPTRKGLVDQLKKTKARSARSGKFAALVLIDLDRFKSINDTHGHDVGDLLLREVAQRLTASLREVDTVARLGGDEFVAILEDLSELEQAAVASAEMVCQKMLDVLNQDYQFGNINFKSSASIGMTLIKGHEMTAEALLKQADLAMYSSKNSGRNLCKFFSSHLEASENERALLDRELRVALAEGQFVLYYQPQIGPDGRLKGAEALIRWQHPSRGLVSPDKFIPFAEQTGLILPIGRWVLAAAARQLAAWAAQPETAGLTLAVNVSMRQFEQADFVDEVISILETAGANPSLLTLELTESLLIQSPRDTTQKMAELKSKGVRFALDDFGTGYSSLFLLKCLPLDELKIDKSFVIDLKIDANDAAIAKMIVSLGRTLGLEVVAEGIETAEQRDFLFDSGCDTGQGYLFSRPVPLEGFETFVQKLQQEILEKTLLPV